MFNFILIIKDLNLGTTNHKVRLGRIISKTIKRTFKESTLKSNVFLYKRPNSTFIFKDEKLKRCLMTREKVWFQNNHENNLFKFFFHFLS